MLVTLDVTNLEGRARSASVSHPKNIALTVVTFGALHLEMSSFFSALHSANMPCMVSTFSVFHPAGPFNVSREWQPLNMRSIFVTCDVSSLFRTAVLRLVHPLNHSLVVDGCMQSSTTVTDTSSLVIPCLSANKDFFSSMLLKTATTYFPPVPSSKSSPSFGILLTYLLYSFAVLRFSPSS